MHDFHLQIDVSGSFCPYPLLETKKTLNELSKGQILKVIATDPASIIDFKAFTSTSIHRLLDYQEIEKGKYCFWIEKG